MGRSPEKILLFFWILSKFPCIGHVLVKWNDTILFSSLIHHPTRVEIWRLLQNLQNNQSFRSYRSLFNGVPKWNDTPCGLYMYIVHCTFLSPSGDLGIGLVWDNHPPDRTEPLFGPTVEIRSQLN